MHACRQVEAANCLSHHGTCRLQCDCLRKPQQVGQETSSTLHLMLQQKYTHSLCIACEHNMLCNMFCKTRIFACVNKGKPRCGEWETSLPHCLHLPTKLLPELCGLNCFVTASALRHPSVLHCAFAPSRKQNSLTGQCPHKGNMQSAPETVIKNAMMHATAPLYLQWQPHSQCLLPVT